MALRNTVNYNQYRGNRLVTAPAVEPITVAEVKSQLRITGTDDDAQIDLYIQAAREQCETYTGIALITQVWNLTLDHWPTAREPWWDGVRQGSIGDLSSSSRASDIMLPRYPLQSVDAINADGESVVVATTFITDTQQMPGRLVLKFGQIFPDIIDRANAIDIQYTAGYGAASTDVPAPLRLALIQMASHLYEHRGDGCSTVDAMEKSGAKNMFDSYIVARL